MMFCYGATWLPKHCMQNERGDNENLGRMLMLALVLIPIVILIATMGDTIFTAANEQWEELLDTDGAGDGSLD